MLILYKYYINYDTHRRKKWNILRITNVHNNYFCTFSSWFIFKYFTEFSIFKNALSTGSHPNLIDYYNNWTIFDCSPISKLLRFKIIWSSSFEKNSLEPNFVQNFRHSYKNGVNICPKNWAFIFLTQLFCIFYYFFNTFLETFINTIIFSVKI